MTGRRLLPSAWWSLAGAAWLGSLLVLGLLSWHLHRTGGGGRLDATLDSRLAGRLGGHRRALLALVRLGSPAGVATGSVVLALVGAVQRWWRAAVLGLVAAPLAAGLTDLVLKPAVGVVPAGGSGLAFPSGHTTGAVALALAACVLLLPARDALPLPAALRIVLGLGALAVAGGTGAAMVALGYHSTSDVVGGVATAVLVVLALAALLDLGRRSP